MSYPRLVEARDTLAIASDGLTCRFMQPSDRSVRQCKLEKNVALWLQSVPNDCRRIVQSVISFAKFTKETERMTVPVCLVINEEISDGPTAANDEVVQKNNGKIREPVFQSFAVCFIRCHAYFFVKWSLENVWLLSLTTGKKLNELKGWGDH